MNRLLNRPQILIVEDESIVALDMRYRMDALGYEQRFRQIVMNLLSNAVKFAERGIVRLDLEFQSAESERQIVVDLRVSDTGIGIPPDRWDVIWESFTQLDASRTRSFGGTGLGLAIVKSLVNLMGGTVSLESQVQRGSVFSVRLPFGLSSDSVPLITARPACEGQTVPVMEVPDPQGDLSTDTEALVHQFIGEFESLQSYSPAIRESAIDTYRKLLLDRGGKMYSRLLLKMLLALRKDDASGLEKLYGRLKNFIREGEL